MAIKAEIAAEELVIGLKNDKLSEEDYTADQVEVCRKSS